MFSHVANFNILCGVDNFYRLRTQLHNSQTLTSVRQEMMEICFQICNSFPVEQNISSQLGEKY